jgi:hypothetical protein
VQEPCIVADRADKQKAKITTDLKKLCVKKVELAALFGAVRISPWILVVPIHDSVQVNLHLTSKAAEVKASGLSYVAPDFEVLVHDLDSFDAGSREGRALQRKSISLPSRAATQQQIDDWTQASNPLVTKLSGKLSKRVGSHNSAELEEAVRETIGWFLERDNALEHLRLTAPQLHEALLGVISRHTTQLRLCGLPPDGTPHHILRAEVEALKRDLQQSVPNFSPASAHQIAFGTVAEWLLRCPLDFPLITMTTSLLDALLDGPFELTPRPEPIAGDLRLAWSIAIVVLMLGRSRGKRASLQKLHFLAHSVRTGQTRQEAQRVFDGALNPTDFVVRVEPWLNRSIAFAKGARLLDLEGGKNVRLTRAGMEMLEELSTAAPVLVEEKAFIDAIVPRATEGAVEKIMRMELRT